MYYGEEIAGNFAIWFFIAYAFVVAVLFVQMFIGFIIEVAADYMDVRSERTQVVVGELVDDITRAKDVLEFSRLQERFELLGQICNTVLNMQVADDEDVHL